MLMLIKRNLLLFFRDKTNVVMSLIAVFVVLGLYFLFLGDMMESGLAYSVVNTSRARPIVAGLFMGGAITLTALSISLAAMFRMVDDRRNAVKDLTVSPISQNKVTLSYLLGSAIIGMIVTLLMFIVVYIYLSIRGIHFIGIDGMALVLVTTVLTVLCTNSIVYFCAMFIKSGGAYTALNGALSTVSGFLMGAYIFIGMMPSAVQWIIKLFPLSHSVAMYRQIFVQDELANLEILPEHPQEYVDALANAPYDYGVVFSFGNFTSTFWFSAGVLLATTALFYGLSLLVHKLRKAK